MQGQVHLVVGGSRVTVVTPHRHLGISPGPLEEGGIHSRVAMMVVEVCQVTHRIQCPRIPLDMVVVVADRDLQLGLPLKVHHLNAHLLEEDQHQVAKEHQSVARHPGAHPPLIQDSYPLIIIPNPDLHFELAFLSHK